MLTTFDDVVFLCPWSVALVMCLINLQVENRLMKFSSQLLLVAVVDGVLVSVCMQDRGGRRETEIAIWPDNC